jgi:DNA-binding transcriptional regulator YiaG
MKATFTTELLARAIRRFGSTAELARALRVPERTLEHWVSGRCRMPERALAWLVEFLADDERDDRVVH